jgi:hypothetical protein
MMINDDDVYLPSDGTITCKIEKEKENQGKGSASYAVNRDKAGTRED